jgi:cytochrome oxidase assembly protein ShyY1
VVAREAVHIPMGVPVPPRQRVVPAYLEVLATPGQDTLRPPRPIPAPVLDEGPHLSYAVQWFIFTLCAAGGWFAVVRRQLREQRAALADPPSPQQVA